MIRCVGTSIAIARRCRRWLREIVAIGWLLSGGVDDFGLLHRPALYSFFLRNRNFYDFRNGDIPIKIYQNVFRNLIVPKFKVNVE